MPPANQSRCFPLSIPEEAIRIHSRETTEDDGEDHHLYRDWTNAEAGDRLGVPDLEAMLDEVSGEIPVSDEFARPSSPPSAKLSDGTDPRALKHSNHELLELIFVTTYRCPPKLGGFPDANCGTLFVLQLD